MDQHSSMPIHNSTEDANNVTETVSTANNLLHNPLFYKPVGIISCIAVFGVGYFIIARSVNLLAKKSPRIAITRNLIMRLVRFLLLPLLILICLQIGGVDLGNLWAIVSAVLGLIAMGFIAMWSLLANITSGIILGVLRPFKLGDVIELIEPGQVRGLRGAVVDINGLFTMIQDDVGNDDISAIPEEKGKWNSIVAIPNSLFFQKITRVKKKVKRVVDENGNWINKFERNYIKYKYYKKIKREMKVRQQMLAKQASIADDLAAAMKGGSTKPQPQLELDIISPTSASSSSSSSPASVIEEVEVGNAAAESVQVVDPELRGGGSAPAPSISVTTGTPRSSAAVMASSSSSLSSSTPKAAARQQQHLNVHWGSVSYHRNRSGDYDDDSDDGGISTSKSSDALLSDDMREDSSSGIDDEDLRRDLDSGQVSKYKF
eukprot:GEZU01006685.1.p1 GENE.GEZU01006685.1~~GEZU01006685.1.p1  ORF type:complete len:432 (-),score=151.42 GEZU01006685.1:53-1348(-)